MAGTTLSQRAWNQLISEYKKYSERLHHTSLEDLSPKAPKFNPLDPKNFDRLAHYLLALKKYRSNLSKAAAARQLHYDLCIKGELSEDSSHRVARLKYNEAAEQTNQLVEELEEYYEHNFDILSESKPESSTNGDFEYVSTDIIAKKPNQTRHKKKSKKGKKGKKGKRRGTPKVVNLPKELDNIETSSDDLERISYLDFLTQRYHQTNQLLSLMTDKEVDNSIILMYFYPEVYVYLFDPMYTYQGKNIKPTLNEIQTDVWDDNWPIIRYKMLSAFFYEFESTIIIHILIEFNRLLNDIDNDIQNDEHYLSRFIKLWKEQGLSCSHTAMIYNMVLFTGFIVKYNKNYLRHNMGISDAMGGLIKHNKPLERLKSVPKLQHTNDGVLCYELLRDKFIDPGCNLTHSNHDKTTNFIHYDAKMYGKCILNDISLYRSVEYMALFKNGHHLTRFSMLIGGNLLNETKGYYFRQSAASYQKGDLIRNCINHLTIMFRKSIVYQDYEGIFSKLV